MAACLLVMGAAQPCLVFQLAAHAIPFLRLIWPVSGTAFATHHGLVSWTSPSCAFRAAFAEPMKRVTSPHPQHACASCTQAVAIAIALCTCNYKLQLHFGIASATLHLPWQPAVLLSLLPPPPLLLPLPPLPPLLPLLSATPTPPSLFARPRVAQPLPHAS